MEKKTINTVDDYIGTFSEDVQKKLNELRAEVKAAAPDAHEELKWSRPAYSDDERILVMFAAFQKHIGFYITPSSLQEFAKDLSTYKTGKGSIQFPLGQPLPVSLIRKMTEYRAMESRVMGVKWKS